MIPGIPGEPTAQTRYLGVSFDTCPLAIFVECDCHIVYLNQAALNLLKDPGSSPLGLPPHDVLREASENPNAQQTASWPIALDMGAGLVSAFVLRDGKQESQIERLYREAPVGLALVDENLRYRNVNDCLAGLNGVPPEAHIGRTVAEVLPSVAPHLEPLLRQVLDSGEPVVDLDVSGPNWEHGGKERHCMVNLRPFHHGIVRGVQGAIAEITSLKETESELLRQTKIFEQVHDSVIQTDLEGRIVAWNGGAERIFGYRLDEIAGQSVSILYFEEDRKYVRSQVFEPVLRNGRHEVELRNRKKDGSECWIRLSLSLLRDRTGSPCGVVGYSEDVTARMRAEAALQSSRTRYRRLFEASPVGIATWGPDGSIVEANGVFLSMLGWTQEQVVSGKLKWRDWNASESMFLELGPQRTFEDELIRSDGSRIPILIGLAKREYPDSEILTYVVDLSSQKTAERIAYTNQEYLELALLGADLGVWDWNLSTGLAVVNERMASMLGYEVGELQPHISVWRDLVHPDDLPRSQQAMQAHMEGLTPVYQCEYRMRAKSGEWRWISARGKVVERSPEGVPLRAAGTHLDISARKEAELAKARSEQRFHAIFDQTFQFIGLVTPEGTLLEANQTALDFGGLARGEVVDRPFWEAFWWTISRETQEQLKTAIERAAAGEFVRYEVDVWGAGKTVATIDFSLRPILENGRVAVMIAEGRNITDLKRAQQILHAEGERRRLEAVLRSMTKGVVIADPEGNVLSMNPAALKLLGIPSAEEARRPLLEFREFELRTLDGVLVPPAEWPLSRAARGETFTGYELEVRRLDTDKRFIAAFGAAPVLDESGHVILLVQSIRDITRQHEVERALRQSNLERDFALQAGRMRTWRWEFAAGGGPEVGIAAAMMGFPFEAASQTAAQVFKLLHPDDRDRVQEFGRHIERDRSYEIEYRLLSSRGDFRWESGRGEAIVSEQGEVVGLAGVTWDITDRKKAEADIESMNSSLHRLSGQLLRMQDEERRRLARELHDGPVQILSAASMNLSMLTRSSHLAAFDKERRLTEECLTWVKQCSEAMRSMSYLLHPPILDELGLTSALRGWITGFADRTGMEVELDLTDVGRLSEETEMALFRIVQEALANVHRHSRSSTASVWLHRGAGAIELEVKDQGCGIPAGVLEGWSREHALGVGIQGMRERALQLGGKMEVQSPQSGGTVIRIVLPDQDQS